MAQIVPRVICMIHAAFATSGDTTDLMQAASQDTISVAASSAIVQIQHLVDEAVHDGAPIKALGNILAQISKQDPGSWGASERSNMDSLLNDVENDMTLFLDAEHRDDEADFATARQNHEQCHSHTQTRFAIGGDVKAEHDHLLEWSVKHEKCRKMEKSFQAYQAEAGYCSATSFTPYTENNEHSRLVTKVETLRTDRQVHHEAVPVGSSTDCDVDQNSYETQFCAWRRSKRFACLSEEDCRSTVGLSGFIDRLNRRSENRRKLLVTLKKITCRIKHLLTTFDVAHNISSVTADDVCDEETVDQVRFQLTMSIPTSLECDTDALVSVNPSSEPAQCTQWRAQAYSGSAWSAADHVFPTVCQFACTDDTPTIVTPSDSCTDTNAQCAFFRHHQDACDLAMYRSGSFVAKDDCCGCTTTSAAATMRASMTGVREGVQSAFTNMGHLYSFVDGTSGTYIADGGDDMYDDGNYLHLKVGGTWTSALSYNNACDATDASSSFGSGVVYKTCVSSSPRFFLAMFSATDNPMIQGFSTSGSLGAGCNVTSGMVGPVQGYTGHWKVTTSHNPLKTSVSHLVVVNDPQWSSTTISPVFHYDYVGCTSKGDGDVHIVEDASGQSPAQDVLYLMWGGGSNHAFVASDFQNILTAAAGTLSAR